MILYNNIVFCHSEIDVGDDLKSFCYDIKECLEMKSHHRQVNLEDIINASDNTLSKLKMIVYTNHYFKTNPARAQGYGF